MTINTISTLPTAPARTDAPATFVTRADAFLAALVVMQGELNTSIGQMNTDIAGVNADATAAAASATAAASSATAAANAAGAALWVSGQAYAEGDAAISLVNYQTYRAETATSGTTDPSLDANWTAISGTFPAQTGNAGKFLSTDGTDPLWTEVSASPTLEAIASGSLGDGDTVIINADGTVSVVSSSILESFDSGAELIYGASNNTNERSITYDSVNNKIIIVYRDDTNNIIARVGTVSGLDITFGSPVTVKGPTSTQSSCVYDPDTQKIIVSYRYNSQGYSAAVVGTVSGNSITFGSEVTFDGNTTYHSMVYHAALQKVVISYVDEANSNHGTSVVGTVSGTTISFGTPVVFNAGTTSYVDSVYDPDSEKVIITYKDAANEIKAIVGTVSGTSISFGAPVTAGDAGFTINYGKIAYDLTAQKVVIVGMLTANGGGRVYVGTVSGTSITFGTPSYFTDLQYGYWPNIVYDSLAQKCIAVALASVEGTASAYLLTISGDTATASSAYQFASSYIDDLKITYDTNSAVAVINGRAGADGSVYVIKAAEIVTNLTSENYIGISDGAYADAATATILVDGSVSQSQTGLTAGQDYYIQKDGTLALTSDVPSVLAGTATSSTNLLIRTNKVPSLTGNSGKFLTTDGVDLSWSQLPPGLELISTTSITSSVQFIDITSGFSSTYDSYVIYGTDIENIIATATIDLQVYLNGTLETGANYYFSRSTGGTPSGITSQLTIDVGRMDPLIKVPLVIEINNANSTSSAYGHLLRASGYQREISFGRINASGAITGIRLISDVTGRNFIGGEIKLYGIKKV